MNNKFIDIFQTWLINIEIKIKYLIKTLKTLKTNLFILIKFKIYYQ